MRLVALELRLAHLCSLLNRLFLSLATQALA
jgi:hypothetical protein